MTPHLSLRAAVIAALASLAVAACDQQTTQQAKREAADAGHKINNALERTGEKIADATRKATAEVKEAAADAKDKTASTTANAGTTDTGRVLSDTAITASIKTDYLKDPDLSVLKIDVDTHDGVVTLNGLAGTPESIVRAEKLASAIKGLKEVRIHVTVTQG
jgi:osmotically-inducible protein OsmY